jgi:dTDP-4-dehydrorhamnose reductase
MLGSEVVLALAGAGIPHAGTDLDIDLADRERVLAFAGSQPWTAIVNCAAYTQVDRAEDEPDAADRANRLAVAHLAEAANAAAAVLIHFSTDYVYDGYKDGAYAESDPVNPLTVYGKSKLAGETAVSRSCHRYFIFRISWLYGSTGNNFVRTMLRLFGERDSISVVDDQFGSPTCTRDVAAMLLSVLASRSGEWGVYNFSGAGRTTWYQFSRSILALGRQLGLVEREVALEPVSSAQYPTKALRPRNSFMSKDKIARVLGIQAPDWEKSLEDFLQHIAAEGFH